MTSREFTRSHAQTNITHPLLHLYSGRIHTHTRSTPPYIRKNRFFPSTIDINTHQKCSWTDFDSCSKQYHKIPLHTAIFSSLEKCDPIFTNTSGGLRASKQCEYCYWLQRSIFLSQCSSLLLLMHRIVWSLHFFLHFRHLAGISQTVLTIILIDQLQLLSTFIFENCIYWLRAEQKHTKN